MGSAFVVDTYNGSALFRSTIVEIVYMCVFLVIPTLTFAISLMARDEEPWRKTAGVWASMVGITFCFWGLAVTWKQVKSCFWLVEKFFHQDDEPSEEDTPSGYGVVDSQDARLIKEWKRLLKIANQALILTQTARYSGKKKQRFHFKERSDGALSLGHTPMETSIGLYSRLTALSFCPKSLNMFETLDPPKRIYSSEEVRDIMPFSEFILLLFNQQGPGFILASHHIIF